MKRSDLRPPRPGSIMVWTLFVIIPIVAFVAMAVDLGLVMAARSECQNAADAAAMAGARTLNGNDASNFNYSDAAPNALVAATDNTILMKNIEPEQVDIQIGRYTYNDVAQEFEAQFPGPSNEPWTMVRATVSYSDDWSFARALGMSAFNTSASASAAHRPRDVCVVVDLSGSMRFDSLIGIPHSGSRTMSNNPESVYPVFGHYSSSSASLYNGNSQTTVNGWVFGSANVTANTNSGPSIIDDFYQNRAMTIRAFSPAPDSYAQAPLGDLPLTKNKNLSSAWAKRASIVIYPSGTTTIRDDDWETYGYENYVDEFFGYTVGPRYWGKTFWIWPPDPRTNWDWRRLYFQWPGSNNPMDDNTRLFTSDGYFQTPGSGSYAINYNAILSFIRNRGPNPFPPSLRAGGVVYYTQIPTSFTTINTGATYPTFPDPPTTQTQKNERFWKDYIDYAMGFEQNGSGGSYSNITSRVGYGSEFEWGTIRITGKPTAGWTYGDPPASMDYRDNPCRPKTHFWFGPMTMVDFLGTYNRNRFWWPGTCHESPTWQCKLGIQAAIRDIKNNHPNDYVSLVFFSHPVASDGSFAATGRFNRVRAPMGQDYDRLMKSLWYPLYVLDNAGSEISPYDNGNSRSIRQVPNAQGGTCYAMGLMLAYNQFSSANVLRTYNTSEGAPVGDAGGLGRRGSSKLLIFETDGVPTFSASAAFTHSGLANSFYHVRAPDEFPSGVSNYGSDATIPTAQAYDIVDQLTALEVDGGYSTARKPVIIQCLGFGALFEPTNAGPEQEAALARLQEMQYRGGMAGGEQVSPETPLPSYKRIVGDSDTRIQKLKEALIKIMQDGVQISLIE